MFNIFPGKNEKHVTLIAVGTSLQSGPYESGRGIQLWERTSIYESGGKFKLFESPWDSIRAQWVFEAKWERESTNSNSMGTHESAWEFEVKRERGWTSGQTLWAQAHERRWGAWEFEAKGEGGVDESSNSEIKERMSFWANDSDSSNSLQCGQIHTFQERMRVVDSAREF